MAARELTAAAIREAVAIRKVGQIFAAYTRCS
jgi:hypothetical protein